MISYEISAQPVGFIVYAIKDGERLSLGAFAGAASMDILEVTKVLTAEGGFKPEPADALGFFLFEDRAQAFVTAMEGL